MAEKEDGMTKLHVRMPGLKQGKGNKRQFRILEQHPDGHYSTLSEPRLDAINKLLLSGDLDRVDAIAQVKRLVQKIKEERGERRPVFNRSNYKILDRFFEYTYSSREIIDPKGAKNDFRRAVEAVGDLPLASASEREIQKALKKFTGEKQRRIVSRLNSIFKYLGRDIKLTPVKPEVREVSYLSPEEVEKVCAQVAVPLAALTKTLFVTGLRLGEAYALTPQSIRSDGSLWIVSQVDRYGARRHTKNRRSRRVVVIPGGHEAIHRWLESRDQAPARLAMSAAWRRACLKILKRDLCLHDLRHSYAVYLVSKGVSVSQVAQSLGNSVLVCERYYSGYALTNESIDTITRILSYTHSHSKNDSE